MIWVVAGAAVVVIGALVVGALVVGSVVLFIEAVGKLPFLVAAKTCLKIEVSSIKTQLRSVK